MRAIIVLAVILLGLSAVGWRSFKAWKEVGKDNVSLQVAAGLTEEGFREAERRNFDKAIEKYSDAINRAPSYKLAYYNRGRVYLERKQLDEALADFDAAIGLDAGYAEAYTGRGDVYWQKRDLENALAAYNRVIDLKPDLPDAYVNRGKVLAESGKRDEALTDYNRAIELSQNNPLAFLWRGVAYSKSREYDLAITDFNRALDLKPDLSEANIKRADALLNLGGARNSQRAIEDYDMAISTTITYDPEPYLNRGKAYKNIRDDKHARDDFDKAFNLSQGKSEYDQIKNEASAQLKSLQPKQAQTLPFVPPLPAVNPTIYLHYRDSNDLLMLSRIAAALERVSKRKYKVASGYQQITQPTTGDVRYFYQEDAANAAEIKEIVERTLKSYKIEKTLELKPLLKYGKRPPQPGWIEVWLPSLRESLNINRSFMNSPYQQRQRPLEK